MKKNRVNHAKLMEEEKGKKPIDEEADVSVADQRIINIVDSE